VNRDEILRILGEFKRDYSAEYGILELGVFGSVARGSAGDQSDVDICVKTETPNPFLLVHIKQELEDRVRKNVHIVRMWDRMNPFLRARIEKEGVYV
jgi:predicted nucleotidyltransferase